MVIYKTLLAAAPFLWAMSAAAGQTPTPTPPDVFDRVKHGYAVSEGGVKIHYSTLGEGPLFVMIQGFPDFWYSWRRQLPALAEAGVRAVALDLRGYNLSDKPRGIDAYGASLLAAWPLTAVLTIGLGVGIAMAALVLEPATTRATLGDR